MSIERALFFRARKKMDSNTRTNMSPRGRGCGVLLLLLISFRALLILPVLRRSMLPPSEQPVVCGINSCTTAHALVHTRAQGFATVLLGAGFACVVALVISGFVILLFHCIVVCLIHVVAVVLLLMAANQNPGVCWNSWLGFIANHVHGVMTVHSQEKKSLVTQRPPKNDSSWRLESGVP